MNEATSNKSAKVYNYNIIFVITDGNVRTIVTILTNNIIKPNEVSIGKYITNINNNDKGACIIVQHKHTVEDSTDLVNTPTSNKTHKLLGE